MSKIITPREYQPAFINNIVQKIAEGYKRIICQLSTGGGKCLAKNTGILMFDGSIKMVQDIVVGDKIMGPDSKERNILSICSGYETMYRITPIKGDPFIVNESHILSLKQTNTHTNPKYPCQKNGGKIINIPILDYLKKSQTWKHKHKQYRVGVEFTNTDNLEIDPYILGAWLGDGNSNKPTFACEDSEIVNYLKYYANKINCNLRKESKIGKCTMYHFASKVNAGCKGGNNYLLNKLRDINVLNNKHIPKIYKASSRDNRLQVLAGLLDTDGSQTKSGFDYISKIELLADDICFLARSLGLAAYKRKCKKQCTNNGVWGIYYRVHITGDCDEIPTKILRKKAPKRLQIKSHLSTGFNIEKLPVGEYFGFEIDGDRLFLLSDFTVTHNTVCFSMLIQRYLKRNPSGRILILVHREELQAQSRATLKLFDILNVSVEMVETFNNKLKKQPDFTCDLLICDEAHRGEFVKILAHFKSLSPDTIILGFTATPKSASKKHPLNADYQTIVVGLDINSLIKQGYLCPAIHHAPETEVNAKNIKVTAGDYNMQQMGIEFSKPKLVEGVVDVYKKYCDGKKALVFNTTMEHSNLVHECFMNNGYPSRSIDSDVIKKDKTVRKETFEWLAKTPGAILNNVGIATTGFDDPSIEAIIFNRKTKSLPLWLQCCGRGARIYEGKQYFIILDLGDNIEGEGFGHWNERHDWTQIFHHPEKPGKGVAPMKKCPECDARIYMAATVCIWCGHVIPRETVYSDMALSLRILPDTPIKKNSYNALQKLINLTADKIKNQPLTTNEKKELMFYSFKELYERSSFEPSPHILSHLVSIYGK